MYQLGCGATFRGRGRQYFVKLFVIRPCTPSSYNFAGNEQSLKLFRTDNNDALLALVCAVWFHVESSPEQEVPRGRNCLLV